MLHEVMMAGLGGQGVMLIGQIVAYAGMIEDRQVSWMPSYGPEMRGGTANCTVIISDQPVASPFSSEPHALIVLNRASLDRFEPLVKPGGVVVVNSSLINREVARPDLRVVSIPANDLANAMDNERLAAIITLGAFLEATGSVAFESVFKALEKIIPVERQKLIVLNIQALQRGATFSREALAG